MRPSSVVTVLLPLVPVMPDHRRVRRTRKELDVAHDLKPAPARFNEKGLGERHAGGDDHAQRALEEARIKAAQTHFNVRIEREEARSSGGSDAYRSPPRASRACADSVRRRSRCGRVPRSPRQRLC
jgi:hypothetical protein